MLAVLERQPRHLRCYSIENPRAGWIVAATHSQAERWADVNLRRAGYRTYLPLYAARRRDPVLRTLTRVVELPLFPGYLFVHWDERESWSPIKAAPGIKALVGAGGKPHMGRSGVVEALQAGAAARRCLDTPGAVWRPGEPCSLLRGPLAELPAVVLSVERRQARIAVMILGDLRTVRAPVAWLAARD